MFTNEAGPWRTARVPYTRQIMDSAGLSWVRRITCVGPTQSGKTEIQNNVIGYFIHQQPSPIMLVSANGDAAKLAGQRRIGPMIRDSKALREECTDRKHDHNQREFAFRRSVLYMRSAHSPTGLASVPVRVVVGDELSKWPAWAGKEANPLKLVQERTRTYYNSLVLLGSTPRFRGDLIRVAYEQGDQRTYWMPCPHCQVWQTFVWSQVKFDAGLSAQEMERSAAAHYECSACNGVIDDRAKRAMVDAGDWVPAGEDVHYWRAEGSKRDRNRHRSYSWWAAYSPWLTWWKIAAEFLESRDSPNLMMNFVNSWLAEDWEERVEDSTEEAVKACIEPRLMSDPEHAVPDEVQVVTAAVDVQADRLEYCVTGWGMDEESWVLQVGKIECRETDASGTAGWTALEDALFRNVWGKRKLRVHMVLIDSRHRRPEVFVFARKWAPRLRMIAGVERDAPVPFSTVKIEKHPKTGVALQHSMVLWTVSVGWFKDLVNGRMRGAIAKPDDHAGRIHLPSDMPEDWPRQLSSEHKVLERSGSKERMRWVLKPGHKRNEAWDLMVYNAAAGRMSRCDMLRTDVKEKAAPAPRRPPQLRRKTNYPSLGGGA